MTDRIFLLRKARYAKINRRISKIQRTNNALLQRGFKLQSTTAPGKRQLILNLNKASYQKKIELLRKQITRNKISITKLRKQNAQLLFDQRQSKLNLHTLYSQTVHLIQHYSQKIKTVDAERFVYMNTICC